jgi:hypothetical protein
LSRHTTDEGVESRGFVKRNGRRLLVLAAVLIVARVVFALAQPWIVDRVASALGTTADYRSLSISFLGGSLEAQGVVVTESGTDQPLLTLNYALVEVDLGALLRGDVCIERAQIDGLYLDLDLTPRASDAGLPPERKDPEQPSGSLPSELPVEVVELRANDLRVHLRGLGEEARSVEVRGSLRASNVGVAGEPMEVLLELASPGVLESLTLSGTGSTSRDGAVVDFGARLRRLRLGELDPLLERLGIVSDGAVWDADAMLRARLDSDEGARLELAASDVSLKADGQDVFRMGELSFAMGMADAGGLEVSRGSLTGVRIECGRSPSGAPTFAGVELSGVPSPASEKLLPSSPTDDQGPAPAPWSIGEVHVADVELTFDDRTLIPALRHVLVLDEITLRDLGPQNEWSLALRAHADGILRSLSVEGRSTPFEAERRAVLALALDGLDTSALTPYLTSAGLRSSLHDASAGVQVSVTARDGDAFVGALTLEDLHLTQGEDVTSIKAIEVEGIELADGRFAFGSVNVKDPKLQLSRDEQGAWWALGLSALASNSTAQPATEPGVAPEQAASGGTTAALPPPSFELGHFALSGASVTLHDAAVQPPVGLQLAGDVTLDDLMLGSERRPATLWAELDAGGLGRATLEGTAAAQLGEIAAVDLALDLTLTRIDSSAIEPYLVAAGVPARVEPLDLAVGLHAELRLDEGLGLEAAVESLSISRGGAVLASLDALRVSRVHADADGVRVPEVAVEGLTLHASRPSESELLFAGVRVDRSPSGEPPAASGAATRPIATEAGEAPRSATEPGEKEGPLIRLLTAPLGLEHIDLRDVAVVWEDLVPESPVATRAVLDGSIKFASPAQASRSVAIDLDAKLDGGHVALAATAEVVDDTASFQVSLLGDRIDTRVAESYVTQLPILTNGRVRAELVSRLEREGDGLRAHLELTEVELRDYDGDVERDALVALDALRLSLLQPDIQRQEFRVEDVALEGLELDLQRDEAGICVAGFSGRDQRVPAEQHSREGLRESVRETLVPKSFRVDAETLPTVHLDGLDLHFARVVFRDSTSSDGEPLTLHGHLTAQPGTVFGTEVDELSPITLELEAHAEPLVRDMQLTLRAQPFATSPEIDIELLLQGIDGGALTAVVPSLAPTIDASAIEDGELSGHANAVFTIGRRGPLELDLSSGIGGDVLLTDLALRGGEGETLASLESLELDIEEFMPSRRSFHGQSLLLLEPTGSLRIYEDAIEIAGIVLRSAKPVASETEHEVVAEAGVAEASVSEAPKREAGNGMSLRLDQLSVGGLDFTLVDERSQPPVALPFDDLTLDVRSLQYPFVPGAPLRMRSFVSLGAVELRERSEGSRGLVGGMLGTARAVVPGANGKGPPLELRPLGQLEVEASLVFEPELAGRVRGDVQSLELGFLRERAKASGVDIRDGLLDAEVDLGFREGALSARTRSTWTSLDVSESENGPVRNFLKLPAPLNAVIFLLRNRHGQVQLNFDFDLPPGGMSRTAVTTKATAAISQVTARAIANSPLRVTSAAGDVLRRGTQTVDGVFGATGLGGLSPFKGKEKEEFKLETLSISYDPGALLMSDAESRELTAFLERWVKTDGLLTVRHDLGEGDLERAAVLANPGEAECRALVTRFKGQRLELVTLRGEVALAAIEHHAAGRTLEGERSAERLLTLDRELGYTENALDELYKLLHPGASRLAGRRTREKALSLAGRRLELLEAILELRFPEARSRVRVLRPRFEAAGDDGRGCVQLITRPH